MCFFFRGPRFSLLLIYRNNEKHRRASRFAPVVFSCFHCFFLFLFTSFEFPYIFRLLFNVDSRFPFVFFFARILHAFRVFFFFYIKLFISRYFIIIIIIYNIIIIIAYCSCIGAAATDDVAFTSLFVSLLVLHIWYYIHIILCIKSSISLGKKITYMSLRLKSVKWHFLLSNSYFVRFKKVGF